MPKYGDKDYWDERYSEDSKPFDWLFDYRELSPLIEVLLPDKDEQLFLIGCGNAPFSPHLASKGKYTNVWNTDISPVVIEHQAARFPEQRWQVMDVLDMQEIQTGSLPVIIDKSLIDTLLCSSEGDKLISKMMDELYRVLSPGSRFISFSLHPIGEVECHYSRHDWEVSFYRIKSKRWNPSKNRKRSLSHTMIVCDKPNHPPPSKLEPTLGGLAATTLPLPPPLPPPPGQRNRPPCTNLSSLLPGLVLTDAEDALLRDCVSDVLLKHALALATSDTVLYSLYYSLVEYAESSKKPVSDEDERHMKRIERLFCKWKKAQAVSLKAAKLADSEGQHQQQQHHQLQHLGTLEDLD